MWKNVALVIALILAAIAAYGFATDPGGDGKTGPRPAVTTPAGR